MDWTARRPADLAGYNVYRSATATGTFTRLNAALVSGHQSYADTSAPVGVSYYQVTAVDLTGNESVRSATVTATRPAPPWQTPVRINSGGPAVTTAGVTWSADQ